MDLDAILLELAKHPVTDVIAKLPKGAGTLHQVLFEKGHDVMRAKATQDEAKVRLELTNAEAARDAAVEKANKAGGSDQTLKTLREDHERIVEDLKGQHKTALKALRDEVTKERVDLAAEEFHSGLLSKGVNPDMAAVQREKHKARLRFAKDGALEIVQEGKDIPFAASSRKEALAMLVEEVVKATPALFLTSTASGGAGAGDNDSTGGSAKVGDAAFYENIRKKAVAEHTGTAAGQRRTVADAFPAPVAR